MIKFELLGSSHDRKAFNCGNPALNRYLQQFANQQGKKFLSKTYVMIDDTQPTQIIGFYSVSALHIDSSLLPIVGFPMHMDIPAVLIGRLAVDSTFAGQGLSKQLIAHALFTVKKAADLIGIALVVVDAKDKNLTKFYEKLGFIKSSDSLRLFMSVAKL